MYKCSFLKSWTPISQKLATSTAMMLSMSLPATAASFYCITDLGTLGGESRAYDLNDSGQVIGYSYLTPGSSDYHAFLWDKTNGMQDLGTLGGSQSEALGMNNSGQVVGYSTTPSGQKLGFLWDNTNGMQNLSALSGGTQSTAYGINNGGVIVGTASNSSGKQHAVSWLNGTITDLDPTYTSTQSRVYRINNNGQTAGSITTPSGTEHARFTGLGSLLSLLDSRVSSAYDINDNGQAVGYAYIRGQQQALQYNISSNQLTSTILQSTGYSSSVARSINNLGDAVGYGMTAGENRALLWENPTQTVDLNTRITPNSGWLLNQAFGINDQDQIVGHGLFNGQTRAFLLTPTTIPILTSFELSDTTIYEGESVTAILSATDTGADPISFWIDNEVVGTDSQTSGVRSVTTNLGSFADESSFTFTAQAKDNQCCVSNPLTKVVTVLNADPVISSLTANVTVREGEKFNFFAGASDPGIEDILTFDWDFDGDGFFNDFTGSSGQWSFANNLANSAPRSVKLKVSDGDGGFDFGEFLVTVENVAPTFTKLVADLTIWKNEEFDFFADAADQGLEDVLSFAWDLDNNGNYEFLGKNGSHHFGTAGDYTLKVQVSDGESGVVDGLVKVTVKERSMSPTPPNPKPVPESSSVAGLLAFGALGIGLLRRRQQK